MNRCVYTYLVIFIFSGFLRGYGQGGTWTWISGDSALNAPAVYGTQGVPSVNNHPGAMYEANEWKDKQGNFWIYGGTYPNYDDLWKFNPITREWTWVKGNKAAGALPVYGQKGVAAPSNSPGCRSYSAPTWVDTAGALWLFGGSGGKGAANDLWKYDIGTNLWTWMVGDTVGDAIGIYGTRGVPSPTNRPGGRSETASAWTDSLNNLWLFGGYGIDKAPFFILPEPLGDVWKYNIGTGEWAWMQGADTGYSPAVFGTMGVPATTNDPGGRYSHSKWKDSDNNFWIMGGYSQAVWKYNPQLNEWTWMSGQQKNSDSARYHVQCGYDTTNRPGSRIEHKSSVTDNCGRFWMFGGTGYSGNTTYSDLWVFDPGSLKWNWIHGPNGFQPGNFGSLGVASSSNLPPSRSGGVAWWSNNNKLYVFGGMHYNSFNASLGDMWMFEPDTNCISFSCNNVIQPPPAADFTASQTSICANNCINYTDLSTNATSWTWLFEGALPATSNDRNPQNICYLDSGMFNVTLIVANATETDTLKNIKYITVNAAPPTPVITQLHFDTLTCSTNPAYSSYQWYANNTLIPGATDTLLFISQSGNYNVEVTAVNGCKIAVGINIILGLKNYMKDNSINLSPNPANETLTISDARFTIGSIDIYNALGMLIRKFIPANAGVNQNSKIDVSISDFPSGVYFIQLIGDKERWAGRFVKE